MSAISLSEPALTSVKRALLPHFPGQRSAHLSEALAAGLGFNTNAALIAFRRDRGDFPDFALLEEDSLLSRLCELAGGPNNVRTPRRGWLAEAFSDLPARVVRPVAATKGRPIATDRMPRRLLQGEILAAAVNEGIRLKLFSLVPDDNRWSGVMEHGRRNGGARYPFRFGPYYGFARATDIGFAELSLHVAVASVPLTEWPHEAKSPRAEPHIVARAGSWLERDRGHWIMDSSHELYLRKSHLSQLEQVHIRPAGFAKRGSFIM